MPCMFCWDLLAQSQRKAVSCQVILMRLVGSCWLKREDEKGMYKGYCHPKDVGLHILHDELLQQMNRFRKCLMPWKMDHMLPRNYLIDPG